jgi:predicted permease
MIDTSRQDLRVGWRRLRRDRGFLVVAVSVLALGICAVTTQFSVVQGVYLRGFSYPNADRLVSVQLVDPTRATPFGPNSQMFSLDYLEMRAEQRSLQKMAAFINGSTVNMTIDGHAKRFTGAYVTEDFFPALGVAPILGRGLLASDNEPGAPKVAIISHQLWQEEFGGAPDVLDRAIRLNGKPAAIVGVMEKGFAFPVNEQLWIPFFNEYPPSPRNDQSSAANTVAILGALAPGVDLDAANAEFGAFAKRLAETYPETNENYSHALVEPLIRTFTPPFLRGLLLTMLAFCAGVLLLACVNVMNMQFARATLRARELAIRSSLGASRGRLIRQMLTESALVTAIGAALGIAGAFWTNGLLMRTFKSLPNPIPAYIAFRVDGPVLAFVVGAAALAALVSGLLPAAMASRANAAAVLNDTGRGNTGRMVGAFNRALVVFQIVVTCVLLIGSLLQLESIVKQQRLDFGYDTAAVLSARLGLMEGVYPDPASKKLFYDRALRELRAGSNYERAALTNRFQMVFSPNGSIEIEGKTYVEDRDRPTVTIENVSDGYFETLGVRLLDGRDFTVDDSDQKLPVAIVNASFAKKHFGDGSPLGRRLRTVADNGTQPGPWRTVVGVVADVRMTGPFNNPNLDGTGFYIPFFASAFGETPAEPAPAQFATLLVRPPAGQRAEAVTPALLADVAKLDPDLPLYFVDTPADNLDGFLGQPRIIAVMFSIFGIVAVVLSAVGLYGVMSYSVNQRTQEFGTRMALGADARAILEMVLRQGLVQLAIGLLLGLGLTLAIAFFGGAGIRQALFEVDPLAPGSYLAVTALITLVAFVATLLPARRATRVDPLLALRAE